MLIIGSDRMTVVGTAGAPSGTRHAVDPTGQVLCRRSRARFTWPALSWDAMDGDEEACPLCAHVQLAQAAHSEQVPVQPGAVDALEAYPVEAYPVEAHPLEAPAPGTALLLWQPPQSLFLSEQ